MPLVIFSLIPKKNPVAVSPDFSLQYKTQKTVDEKIAEWDNGGWQSDSSACLVDKFLVANPDDITSDIELPATHNSVIQIVNHITSTEDAVVTDDFTYTTCVLMNTLFSFMNKVSGKIEESNDDAESKAFQYAMDELGTSAAELYAFKLEYISQNFVGRNNHNITKTLQLDKLSNSVLCAMLNMPADSTRLSLLAKLADNAGLGACK